MITLLNLRSQVIEVLRTKLSFLGLMRYAFGIKLRLSHLADNKKSKGYILVFLR
ncbi:hypothetical protein [Brunnivagina elsteri]|uniref:hypothetical protein n=1 Tax=Brunnivagina elsteri TaxID=1247191 RepID=UPI001B804167|nr:hypothetical protein [Calothrix elsteri]